MVFDKDDLGRVIPPPSDPLPDAGTITYLIEEILRQAANFPAVVLRDDWLMGVVAVQQVQQADALPAAGTREPPGRGAESAVGPGVTGGHVRCVLPGCAADRGTQRRPVAQSPGGGRPGVPGDAVPPAAASGPGYGSDYGSALGSRRTLAPGL